MQLTQTDRVLLGLINQAPKLLLADGCRKLQLLAVWLSPECKWSSRVFILASAIGHVYEHLKYKEVTLSTKIDDDRLIAELLYQLNYMLGYRE